MCSLWQIQSSSTFHSMTLPQVKIKLIFYYQSSTHFRKKILPPLPKVCLKTALILLCISNEHIKSARKLPFIYLPPFYNSLPLQGANGKLLFEEQLLCVLVIHLTSLYPACSEKRNFRIIGFSGSLKVA